MRSDLAVILLAAGKGKRMANPDLPKVMVELSGKPMLGRVLEIIKKVNPKRLIVVVGYHREIVIGYIKNKFKGNIEFATQEEQLGTGHAVLQAHPPLKDFNGDVLILSGDVPLLTETTLNKLINYHLDNNNDLSMLTTHLPNPTGYGRIIRNEQGEVVQIIEEKDADDKQKLITEINPAIYIVKSEKLFNALSVVSNYNTQGEYYLTDIVEILKSENAKLGALVTDNYKETVGVNTQDELRQAESFLT